MSKSDQSSELIRVLEDNAGIIYKLSFMYSNSAVEAEDLRQEIRYQVVKSFENFKGQSKISTWVYKVGLFTALSHLKEEKKAQNLVFEVPEIIDQPEDEDRWNEVMVQIKQLAMIDRSIVFLYLENKSYAEMADILGMTESNLGARLSRLKQKLREKLK